MMVVWMLLGLAFGLASGQKTMQTRVQRRLREFFEAKGLRVVDRDGSDVPMDDLADALRKG